MIAKRLPIRSPDHPATGEAKKAPRTSSLHFDGSVYVKHRLRILQVDLRCNETLLISVIDAGTHGRLEVWRRPVAKYCVSWVIRIT